MESDVEVTVKLVIDVPVSACQPCVVGRLRIVIVADAVPDVCPQTVSKVSVRVEKSVSLYGGGIKFSILALGVFTFRTVSPNGDRRGYLDERPQPRPSHAYFPVLDHVRSCDAVRPILYASVVTLHFGGRADHTVVGEGILHRIVERLLVVLRGKEVVCRKSMIYSMFDATFSLPPQYTNNLSFADRSNGLRDAHRHNSNILRQF